MKRKNIVIMASIFIVLFVGVIIFAINQKNSRKAALSEGDNYYEVVESSGLSFKGMSVIKEEQKIFIDSILGSVEKVNITDKAEVKKGDLILTYFNDSVQEQIDNLKLQYASTKDKVNRANGDMEKTKLAINKKENSIAEKNTKLSNLNDMENMDEKATVQQEIAIEEQELQMLKSELQNYEVTSVTFKDTLKELDGQVDGLKKKLRKDVTAELDGIAYIKTEGLTNPGVEYINIVSKEPLVKGMASEYDVLKLKVGQEVLVKVVSTGQTLKGTVTAIDDLPSTTPNGTGVAYNFYVKPEGPIRIGFSVEIKENIDTLEVPKDFVSIENGSLMVAKVIDDGVEKIEVNGVLEEDYYLISRDKIAPGDKLTKEASAGLEKE
ncbi:hypothetical protein ACPWSR_03925 [Alloiococcus sp. CFN-8]|uniref:hypothetical protein n=1 Tax=Alloiococcus sp. CFN-8 TaxID=3416081 RepID=UPI003CE7647F